MKEITKVQREINRMLKEIIKVGKEINGIDGFLKWVILIRYNIFYRFNTIN